MGQGPLKRYTIELLLETEIAPVELNGLNEITTSKDLERMQSGKHESSRYLEHFGTNEQREMNEYEEHRYEKAFEARKRI